MVTRAELEKKKSAKEQTAAESKATTAVIELDQEIPSYTLSVKPEKLSGQNLLTVIENYIQYYACGDNHTARAKRYDLQYFLAFLGEKYGSIEAVNVSDWTLQSTKDFIEQRLSGGESPATVSRRLATIKHLGRTLADRVPGFVNPAREARGPSLTPNRPQSLSSKEVELLRKAALLMRERKDDDFISIRNHTLLETLLATGLRADEVRMLAVGQISADGAWLKNVKTKGKKFRNVYLDSEIRIILSEYLEQRELALQGVFNQVASPDEIDLAKLPVFLSVYRIKAVNPTALRLSPKTIWRVISEFGERAQAMSKERLSSLHPHLLRHTFAHGLLDSSKDVRLVAQALGHSDVRTTMRYTERTDEALAEAMEKRLEK